ncbi:MAG: winged helix-turn-helix transcriptional regulator, partial [Anaerolineaceae bacterium]|nr:winged helix-turn-helix transcriptional regulator [Anaerolineaceae bacterium]
ITRIFRVIKLSENAGSGFDKMFNGWKTYYDEPVVSGGIDFYKITFPLVKTTEVSEETRGIVGEKGGQTTPQITPQINLTSLENNIVNEIIKNPAITRKQIASNLGISPETVKEYLEKLKKKGLLRRIGAARGGYWEVIR